MSVSAFDSLASVLGGADVQMHFAGKPNAATASGLTDLGFKTRPLAAAPPAKPGMDNGLFQSALSVRPTMPFTYAAAGAGSGARPDMAPVPPALTNTPAGAAPLPAPR